MALTLMYEQSLQAINPAVTVPYWDFTLESTFFGASDFRTSGVFADDWFGNASPPNVRKLKNLFCLSSLFSFLFLPLVLALALVLVRWGVVSDMPERGFPRCRRTTLENGLRSNPSPVLCALQIPQKPYRLLRLRRQRRTHALFPFSLLSCRALSRFARRSLSNRHAMP